MGLILGHRGMRGSYPENTLIGFEKAICTGADGVEFDIHLSKDGIPMVFHDFTLERLCGVSGVISDYTAQELKQFEIRQHHMTEHIPTLEEVLRCLAALQSGRQKPLYVNAEFKSGSLRYPGIEALVVSLCLQYFPHEQLIFSSFDHYALRAVHNFDADAVTGVLTASMLWQPKAYLNALGATYYHPYYETLLPEALADYHTSGILLNTYTVNDPGIAKKLLKAGVHSIITDFPEACIAAYSTV